MFAGIEYPLLPAKGKDAVHPPGEHVRPSSAAVTTKKLRLALLEELFIRADMCDVSEFPEEIFEKPKVKEICLSRNRIPSIPPDIGTLKTLKVLRLDRNCITEIPFEISNLTNLTHLDLEGNLICDIPVELGLMVQLQFLNLLSNPLTGRLDDDQPTFLDVYNAETTLPAAGTRPASALIKPDRDSIIKRNTKITIDYLRRHLPPEQVTTIPRIDDTKLELLQEFREAMYYADSDVLSRAVHNARLLGVEGHDMEKAQKALKLSIALRLAVQTGDKQKLANARQDWEKHCSPMKPQGPDYEAAGETLQILRQRDIARKQLERRAAEAANSQYTLASMARTRQERLESSGARSYEDWLREKEEQQRKERQALEEFKVKVRKQELSKRNEALANAARLAAREKQWPSTWERGQVPPGRYQVPERMQAARRMYSAPANRRSPNKANGGLPNIRAYSARGPGGGGAGARPPASELASVAAGRPMLLTGDELEDSYQKAKAVGLGLRAPSPMKPDRDDDPLPVAPQFAVTAAYAPRPAPSDTNNSITASGRHHYQTSTNGVHPAVASNSTAQPSSSPSVMSSSSRPMSARPGSGISSSRPVSARPPSSRPPSSSNIPLPRPPSNGHIVDNDDASSTISLPPAPPLISSATPVAGNMGSNYSPLAPGSTGGGPYRSESGMSHVTDVPDFGAHGAFGGDTAVHIAGGDGLSWPEEGLGHRSHGGGGSGSVYGSGDHVAQIVQSGSLRRLAVVGNANAVAGGAGGSPARQSSSVVNQTVDEEDGGYDDEEYEQDETSAVSTPTARPANPSLMETPRTVARRVEKLSALLSFDAIQNDLSMLMSNLSHSDDHYEAAAAHALNSADIIDEQPEVEEEVIEEEEVDRRRR